MNSTAVGIVQLLQFALLFYIIFDWAIGKIKARREKK
jgi:hypothetical protein